MTSNESSSEVKQKISKTMRNQVKALIAGQDWPVAVFEQLGGRLDECPGGSVIDRDTALSILGLTIDQAVDKWLIQFSARVRELNDASARAVASEKKERPDSRNQYVETSTDPFSGKTWGKDRHSALIFMEYADRIRREEGTDVYETKAQLEANDSLLRRLIEQYRKDKTFADASILDGVEQELLRDSGVLSKEEQQAKDECNLAKARAVKDDLRESGMSDAPRSGFCKRAGCPNRKVERLLVRGFCPDCRGLNVKQRIPKGNGRVDATVLGLADATATETRTSIRVSANRKNVHPDVLKPTMEERREKVLAAREDNPSASVREIARLTNVPRATVNDILNSKIAKTKPVNTPEVEQFLQERSNRRSVKKN
jgi:transposase-like protein